MKNFKKDIKQINKDYTSLYFALYMTQEYGVEVGYVPVSPFIINSEKILADWQLKSDCCTLCTRSKLPGQGKISSYARLPETTDYCSPFQPLYAGGSQRWCDYKGIGDFNRDFNNDFFK